MKVWHIRINITKPREEGYVNYVNDAQSCCKQMSSEFRKKKILI